MIGAGLMALMMELRARDLTGPALSSAEARTRRLGRTTRSEFAGMMQSAVSYRKLVGSVLTAKVLSRGAYALEQGVIAVGRGIVEMDQALTAASAKFGEVSYRGTEGFARMEEQVRSIGKSTEFTSAQAASGLDFLAMAGFEYEQSLRAIVPLTDLATAAQMDLARASDIASDAIGAFNLDASADEIERSLNRVNDVFAKTVTSSNTTMETLFDTMKHAGPAVTAAGADIEMFGTLTGRLGSAGIKGTIAGTALKNMFTRLVAPPSEAQKALRKLHIEVDDGTGRMKDMITILDELNQSFTGKSEIAREAFIKDIFGMRAISGVNVLLKAGTDDLRAYYEQIKNSSGAAKEMADVMRGGLGVQLKVLESTLMEKGFEIFTGLMGEDDPVEAVKELSAAIREFDTRELVEGLRIVGKTAAGIAEFFWDNREAVGMFLKVWIAANLGGKIGSLVQPVTSLVAALTGGGGAAGAGLVGAAASSGTALAGAAAQAGVLRLALLNAQPVILAAVAGLTTGYEIWKKLEAAQEKQTATENKYIKMYSDAQTMSYSEASEEALKIQQHFAEKKGLKGRARYENFILRGVEDENRIRETYGIADWDVQGMKDRYMMEAFYALQRRRGLETTGQGWINIYGRQLGEQKEAERERLREERYGFQQGGFPWENALPQTQHHGQSIMPDMVWAPKQEFLVSVKVEAPGEGFTATAEVTKAPGVDEKKLGKPNG